MKNCQLKPFVLQGLLLLALVSLAPSLVRAVDWSDDFEGYAPGSSVGTNWVLSANITNIADSAVAFTGTQSLKMVGGLGAGWVASASKTLDTCWSTKGLGFNHNVSMPILYNGNVVVSGPFTTVDGIAASRIASYDGTSWSPLGGGLSNQVNGICEYNGNLVATGFFPERVSLWDGMNWTGIAPGTNSAANFCTVYRGDLIVGGFFTTIGGVSASHIAKWDGISWSPLGSGLSGILVLNMQVYNDKLYVGGLFNQAGGIPTKNIAVWDGISWGTVGAGFDGGVVGGFGIYQNRLVATGYFTSSGGVSLNRIAIWNDLTGLWEPFGTGFNGNAGNMLELGNDLYVGGNFSMAGDSIANNIARWDGTTWHPLGSGTDKSVGGAINYQGNLIVVGEFTTAGGLTANHWAMWDYGCSTVLSFLTFPSVIARPCDSEMIIQPVVCDLSQPASGATIPVKIPPGVTVSSISYQGLITETWEVQIDTILADSGYLSVALANFQGLTIPAGQTTLFNILFRAPRECRTESYIHWDTALYNDIGRQLKFSDTANRSFGAVFDISADSTMITKYIPGNIDDDTSGTVDITDLTMLIDHLFINFPALCVNDAGNCSGDLVGPDIADLTALIDHLFINFGPLYCPGANPILAKQTNSVFMESIYENGRTTIRVQTDVDLRGVELTLTGDGSVSPENLLAGSLDLMSGMREGKLRIGLADLDGGNTISAGKTNLVELDGNWQIEHAIVSDINHQSINALSSVAGSDDLLPAEYALIQNYPNPFNPSTNISFSLPVASNVRLDIYNMLGQNVTTLVDKYMEAGEHSVTWNAGNSASGVYFYRLTSGDFVAKKKMILLK